MCICHVVRRVLIKKASSGGSFLDIVNDINFMHDENVVASISTSTSSSTTFYDSHHYLKNRYKTIERLTTGCMDLSWSSSNAAKMTLAAICIPWHVHIFPHSTLSVVCLSSCWGGRKDHAPGLRRRPLVALFSCKFDDCIIILMYKEVGD